MKKKSIILKAFTLIPFCYIQQHALVKETKEGTFVASNFLQCHFKLSHVTHILYYVLHVYMYLMFCSIPLIFISSRSFPMLRSETNENAALNLRNIFFTACCAALREKQRVKKSALNIFRESENHRNRLKLHSFSCEGVKFVCVSKLK